nr:nucleic acid-binding, OB-fold protein [Tanacetum cinerariifolium]
MEPMMGWGTGQMVRWGAEHGSMMGRGTGQVVRWGAEHGSMMGRGTGQVDNEFHFIFVKGFSKQATEDDLRMWFDHCGSIDYVYIPKRSRYGFVYFNSQEAVNEALKLHDSVIEGGFTIIVRLGIPGDGKYWRRRRVRTKSSIGRLTYVHPAAGDLFYQRMLLCHQKGCKSFLGIRTVNDIVYPTCQAACEALGLLENDREWEITLEEAALTATPAEQELVFVYGHGGTGKTFLWKTIIFSLRSKGKIVLVVASSENMRLNSSNLQDIDMERVSIFAQWLLDIENRNNGTPDECDPENCSWIDIPEHYCIPDDGNGISNLINFIYDNEMLRYPSAMKLQDKAIVCPKNDTTDIINNKILSLLPGRAYTYLSYDEAIPHGHDGGEVELLYPMEYLNTLSFPGLPPHRSMATTSISKSTSEEKGKMIITKPNVTIIADLKPMDTNKTLEAVVYHKWTSKHVQTQQPMKYCCILLDKQGTPIQANMDVKDTTYFDRLLQLRKAYRISRFSCEQTGEDFPEHYFNFTSYNELAGRADKTDYIGRIQAVSRIHTFGDATSNRIHRRIIDIQNLSGNTISLALWHDMAVNFNLQEYEALERPVVIAVSSCWVRRYHDYKSFQDIHFLHAKIMDLSLLLYTDNDQYKLPSALKELEGTTHVFQFHFDSRSSSRRRNLVLDRVFETRIPPCLHHHFRQRRKVSFMAPPFSTLRSDGLLLFDSLSTLLPSLVLKLCSNLIVACLPSTIPQYGLEGFVISFYEGGDNHEVQISRSGCTIGEGYFMRRFVGECGNGY